jgi:fructose/tagatose bisphosphate aldolase
MTTTQRVPLADAASLKSAISGAISVTNGSVEILDADRICATVIDDLVYTGVFGEGAIRDAARWLVRVIAPKLGAFPASIHELYLAGGRGEYTHATAPAINVRALAYDNVQAILRAARANDNKIVLFEIARSEMSYTWQRPGEYATSVLAGAIKAGWQGPVFIQGDHFQAISKAYNADPEKEIGIVRDLTKEAIAAGFYNIDVDASTLVDIDEPDLVKQQEKNYRHTAELTALIRSVEPAGVTVSVGGEIGEVGKSNSTVADLTAFMTGYIPAMEAESKKAGRALPGISKISVQTGTSHGGIVLPDGTIKQVAVDFETLAELSKAAREQFGLGGAVQHGASTLPESAFGRFAEANAIEVHLATAFQSVLLDSEHFPSELLDRMYAYLADKRAEERKEGETDAQFYYKTRKRVFGPFKQELWNLPAETRAALMSELESTYSMIMQHLGVSNSAAIVDRIVKPIEIDVPMPEGVSSILG